MPWNTILIAGVSTWMTLVLAVCVGVGAYACLMKAMRTGDVSAVTPFRYSRLLFGIGFGVLWFGESMSLQMIVGSALIVLSGLVIIGRWRRKKPRIIQDSPATLTA